MLYSAFSILFCFYLFAECCWLWCCDDFSAKKAELLVKALRQTLSDFCRDRSLKRLSYNEEQIHKFDKSVAVDMLSVCCFSLQHLPLLFCWLPSSKHCTQHKGTWIFLAFTKCYSYRKHVAVHVFIFKEIVDIACLAWLQTQGCTEHIQVCIARTRALSAEHTTDVWQIYHTV